VTSTALGNEELKEEKNGAGREKTTMPECGSDSEAAINTPVNVVFPS
jgi:hypothetical protein